MRGRKPTPTRLKILQNNPGKRALPADEPRAAPAKPPCPAHLDKLARAEWRRLAGRLFALGILTDLDRGILAAYCQAWGRWVQAERELAKEGPILTSAEGGLYQNPYLHVSNKAQEQLHKFGAVLGLSPSDRCRLRVPPRDEASELEAFMKEAT